MLYFILNILPGFSWISLFVLTPVFFPLASVEGSLKQKKLCMWVHRLKGITVCVFAHYLKGDGCSDWLKKVRCSVMICLSCVLCVFLWVIKIFAFYHEEQCN